MCSLCTAQIPPFKLLAGDFLFGWAAHKRCCVVVKSVTSQLLLLPPFLLLILKPLKPDSVKMGSGSWNANLKTCISTVLFLPWIHKAAQTIYMCLKMGWIKRSCSDSPGHEGISECLVVWLCSGGRLMPASFFHCSFYFDRMGYFWKILPCVVGKFSHTCFFPSGSFFPFCSSEKKANISILW